jgi:hypothetical protein
MIHIRPAVSDDAPALLDIYAPYVIETAITFEYEVPTLDDFRQRIKNTLHTHPYLVMERDGEIVGYAYTGQLGSRAAYAWAAETSIYLRQDCRRGGFGHPAVPRAGGRLPRSECTGAVRLHRRTCFGRRPLPDSRQH